MTVYNIIVTGNVRHASKSHRGSGFNELHTTLCGKRNGTPTRNTESPICEKCSQVAR